MRNRKKKWKAAMNRRSPNMECGDSLPLFRRLRRDAESEEKRRKAAMNRRSPKNEKARERLGPRAF
jgi:hypothetical protein